MTLTKPSNVSNIQLLAYWLVIHSEFAALTTKKIKIIEYDEHDFTTSFGLIKMAIRDGIVSRMHELGDESKQ